MVPVLISLSRIRTIYLLVRPGKGCSAKQRFRNEVLSSHVFSRLRSEIGDAEFERLANEKLVVVSGDLTQKCLGNVKRLSASPSVHD